MSRAKLAVSGELNDSVAEGHDSVEAPLVDDQTGVDDFLTQEKKSSKQSALRASNARGTSRKSVAQSMRESIGYISTNKFGEGRRVQESGEAGQERTSKQRQSEAIEKLGTFSAAASIFKAFVGLGILFMSQYFHDTGIVAMPLIMLGSLILTLYCTKLLLECADDYGDAYSEIAFAAYGNKVKKLTEWLIIGSQMGFCTNYVYFIASQMGSVLNCARPGAIEETCWDPEVVYKEVQLWYLLPILMAIYVPLVWIRNMEKLAFTHLISDVIIFFVVISIFVYAGINLADEGASVSPLFTVQFYKAIPYSAFAFEGVAVVLPLRDIVADQAGYYKLCCIVVSSIAVFYILFAEWTNLGYNFDKNTYVLITDALPATGVFTWILKSLFTVNLFFTYPMQLTPAVTLIESFIFDPKSAPTTQRYWMQNLFRTVLVAFTIALAILVYPKITLFIEVIAAATCCPLAFTLPAAFHYKLMGKNKAHLVIVIATCILTFFMVGQAIYELIHDFVA